MNVIEIATYVPKQNEHKKRKHDWLTLQLYDVLQEKFYMLPLSSRTLNSVSFKKKSFEITEKSHLYNKITCHMTLYSILISSKQLQSVRSLSDKTHYRFNFIFHGLCFLILNTNNH